jgi:hypothetical protein
MKANANLKNYSAIEAHIRTARIERSVLIAELLANAIQATVNGFKRLGAAMTHGLDAEVDRRAIEADAFLKRSVPRYW